MRGVWVRILVIELLVHKMLYDILIGLIIGLFAERYGKITIKLQAYLKKRKELKGAK